MGKYLKNRQFGYFTPDNKDQRVRMLDHQQIAGYSVGVIYIEDVYYPFVPGNVVNAHSYDFPVRMQPVPDLDIDRLFAADPTIADDIIALGQHMIDKEGVRALSSACGFFGNFHAQVAEALDIPVALSTIAMTSWIQTLIKPSQKIGVLTADAKSLNPGLFKSCYVEDPSRLIIKDLRHEPEFSCILEYRGEFDNAGVTSEVVGKAMELLEENADIGAILLECSDMPPYAYAVQAATQLPVFDYITMINFLHKATTQRPYCGWI
ncbi:MAG: aspartate/glutamate racemase family protein [Bacillota bacterium]|nr:aspartate/glutamate racemase family protein [Bacillota bacterium]